MFLVPEFAGPRRQAAAGGARRAARSITVLSCSSEREQELKGGKGETHRAVALPAGDTKPSLFFPDVFSWWQETSI